MTDGFATRLDMLPVAVADEVLDELDAMVEREVQRPVPTIER